MTKFCRGFVTNLVTSIFFINFVMVDEGNMSENKNLRQNFMNCMTNYRNQSMHYCYTPACSFIPYTPEVLIALQLHTYLHFTRPAHILHEVALILHPPHSTCTQYDLMLRSCCALHFTCTQYALLLHSCLHFYPLLSEVSSLTLLHF